MTPIASERPALHPAQQAILDFFAYEHLPERQRRIAEGFHTMAHELCDELHRTRHGAELTTGLRKLLEAKDCAVRASLD